MVSRTLRCYNPVMNVRIANLSYVVTPRGVLTDQDIVVRDGTVASITATTPPAAAPPGATPPAHTEARRETEGPPRADGALSPDRTIDGTDRCALAGFKNAHTHAAMTLLRGYGDDMRLQEWLQQRIWPAEATLTGDDIYWGTRLAALEMIKSGTTFANDMYFFFPDAFRAFQDSGIRAAVGLALFDFNDAERRRAIQREVDDLLDRFVTAEAPSAGTAPSARSAPSAQSAPAPRVFPTIAPHSVYTCSGELLRWAAERAAEFDLPFHIHMSETKREVDDCVAAQGVRPWQYLDKLGVLKIVAGRGIAAHGVWLDESELALIADNTITLAHNPASNMKLASGAFDWSSIVDHEIPVMLAPDGVASNNNLDMFDEMKLAALLQKHHFGDPTRLTAREALAVATGAMSSVFEPWGVGGGIDEGAPADIILVDLNHPQMAPVHNIESNLVYAANGTMVDTVLCGGEVLMERRVVPGEEDVRRKATERAHALVRRSG